MQTVWNVLTRRAVDYGIGDYDVFYFDPDTSWQAEDAVIRELQGRLAKTAARIEARNQARVHLWYPQKHRLPYPALLVRPRVSTAFSPKIPRSESAAAKAATSLRAARFDDIADMIVRPNPGPNFSRPRKANWKIVAGVTVLTAMRAEPRVATEHQPVTSIPA